MVEQLYKKTMIKFYNFFYSDLIFFIKEKNMNHKNNFEIKIFGGGSKINNKILS